MKILISLLFFICIANCVSIQDKPNESEVAGTYHRVKKGDSLGLIAKKYRINPDEIKDVNGLENGPLQIGQEIFIPDPDPIGTKIAKHQSPRRAKKSKKEAHKNSSKKTASTKKIFEFPVPGGTVFHQFSSAKKNPYDGLGIQAPRGTAVRASLDGKVIFVGDDGTRYGLLVIIEHQEPFISVYAHLDKALVQSGQRVEQGQQIGTVGSSGGTATPRLHFQIRVSERPKDPKLYLKTK